MKTSRVLTEPEGEFSAQEQLQLLGTLDGQCRQILYWSGRRTVPERLREWLKASGPGYAIPFHAVFEDEIPDAEDRQKILEHLAWTPAVLEDVGGIVDPQSGLVFLYDSQSGVKRWLSPLWVLAVVGVGAGIVRGLAEYPPLDGSRRVSDLLIGWLAVLVGVLLHTVIGASKRLRGQGATAAVLPISRSLILLNARLGFVLFRIATALVGYLGLVYAAGAPQFNAFVFNALLVGYSLDSVVELFGTTFDQRSAAQLANLKKRMGT
jgi:hypothetical protein